MIRKTLLALLCLTLLAAHAASAQFTVSLTNKTITGTVSGSDGNRIFLFDNRLTVNAANATIRSDYGPATLGDLTPGTRISAGIRQVLFDGSLDAATVQILPDHDASFSAEIERIDWAAGTLRIGGLTVRITESTQARRLEDGAVVPVTELRPLQRVLLTFDRDQSGLAAETVVFSAFDDTRTSMIGGALTAINGNLWTIGFGSRGTTVRVTGDTYIAGDPRVGDRVEVTYRGDAAGDLVALRIFRISSIGEEDVAGEVRAIGPNTIVLDQGTGAKVVHIDAGTRYRGTPEVGELFVARLGSDGVANLVEEIYATDFTFTLSGEVTSIKGDEWMVQGVTFYNHPNGLVTGSPQVGDQVYVRLMELNGRWYVMSVDKL